MTKPSLLMCLCILFAGFANAADNVRPPEARSCVEERASAAESALWQAYQGCVVQADVHRITGDARGEFISGCTTRRAGGATANGDPSSQCSARARTLGLTGAPGQDFVNWCDQSRANCGISSSRSA